MAGLDVEKWRTMRLTYDNKRYGIGVDFVIGIGVDYMIGFGVNSKLAMARHGLGAKNSLGIDVAWN